MTKARARAAAMFEMLAVLHLHAPSPPEQQAETSPQIDRVLWGFKHMSQQEWSDFLRFAELQRVSLRTLRLVENWTAAGALAPQFDGLENLAQVEQQQIGRALATLDQVVRALELTGHSPS
jgi:hypothetical protein